jgi:hypothetical protein
MKTIENLAKMTFAEIAKNTSFAEKEEICAGYRATDLRHYNTIQTDWVSTAKYFLGMRLKHNPDELELLEDLENQHLFVEFKFFYILTNPTKIIKIGEDNE